MLNKIVNYFQEVWVELTKVTWPTRKMLVSHSLTVILAILVSMLIVGLIDYGFTKLIDITIINRGF